MYTTEAELSQLREEHERLLKENIVKRCYLLDKAKNNLKNQQDILKRCREDIHFWVDHFVVSFNPRENPSLQPFVCFPRQREMFQWMDEMRERKTFCTVVKSRYTGASVISMAYLTHKFLFEPNFLGAIASRKKDLVHRMGDPDSLIEKAKDIISRLPGWMKPSIEEKTMLLVNKDNGAVISGQSGEGIGRGGRSSVVIIDEAAFLEGGGEPQLAALSENTDTAFWVSTPNGTGNTFYQLAHNEAVPKFEIAWWHDPRRTMSWYEQKCAQFPEHVVNAELNLDFYGSVEGVAVKAKHVRAAINAIEQIPEMRAIGDRRVAGFDVSSGGKNKSVLTIRRGCVVEEIISWEGLDTTQSAYKVDQIMREKKIKHLNFDACGIGEGIAATLNTLGELPYTTTALISQSPASDREWIDEERTAKEKFLNCRSELWGNIRERFRKTYEVLNGIKDHPYDELISIPNEGELIRQLSQPLLKYSTNGKEKIESKEDMKKRGISSPDHADSLVYCFEDDLGGLGWFGVA